MKATNSCTITWGLVSIPSKVYSGASARSIAFNLITPKGNPVKQKLVDKITNEEVDRSTLKKGYEYAKNKWAVFSQDEMTKLNTGIQSSKTLELKEFINGSELSHLQVEKYYYLGPDKGADKSFSLLSATLDQEKLAGVAKWTNRCREHLVLIRPCRKGGIRGLIMEQLYYANEVNDFVDIGVSGIDASPAEMELALLLVNQLKTNKFDISKYKDEYAANVLAAVEAKTQGNEVVVGGDEPKTTMLDLFDALKQSLFHANKTK